MNFYFLHESIIKQRRTSKTQEQIRPNYPPVNAYLGHGQAGQ